MLKKGGNDVPVDACKGWQDTCEYCDKRFGEWINVTETEDIYEKIPEKPGFFMVALKNKNNIEVVSILYNEKNIQKAATAKMDDVKEEKSNKKSKATKAIMLVRWMVIKKPDDKENSVLCAHWINNGVLPRFTTQWPGLNLLEKSEAVVFSKQLQKWCYPQKNPTWRKPKPPPSKTIEEIAKCDLESCEICDSYFSKWKLFSDVTENDLAPEDNGIVMFSAVYGKHREVILIPSDRKNVTLSIKSTIKNYTDAKWLLREKKFEGKNPRLEVRWMVVKDINCDNSCLMYAHWLNADKWPLHNGPHMPLPGEELLSRNKHFVYRNNDKKWFYETEALKKTKFSKAKNKRRVYDELHDELYYEDENP